MYDVHGPDDGRHGQRLVCIRDGIPRTWLLVGRTVDEWIYWTENQAFGCCHKGFGGDQDACIWSVARASCWSTAERLKGYKLL